MNPTVICKSIRESNLQTFDAAVTAELNDEEWEFYDHTIHFQGDEHSFYAHILFTAR
jgi:hypothetical protein